MQYGGRRSSSSSQSFPDLLLLLTFTTSLLQTPSLWCSYPAIDIMSFFCFPVTVKLIVHASVTIKVGIAVILWDWPGHQVSKWPPDSLPETKIKTKVNNPIQRQIAEVTGYRGPIIIMRLGKVTCLGKTDSQNDPPSTEALLKFD